MAFDLDIPIRAVQFLFAVIALGLNGYGTWKERKKPPPQKAFSFFLPSSLPTSPAFFFPFAFVPTLLFNLNLSIQKKLKINK